MDQEDLTRLLEEMDRGVPGAKDRVYRAVYEELRGNASAILGRIGRPRQLGATLQTTALVNEAYLRFSEQRTLPTNRRQFFGVFTICIRRALQDYLKQIQAQKRGRRIVHVSFDPERDAPRIAIDVTLLLDALEALELRYPSWEESQTPDAKRNGSPKAIVGTLRLLMGWTADEICDRLSAPLEDTDRDWEFARAFVRKYLAEHSRPAEGHKSV